MNLPAMQRCDVFYTGLVQGVGFRYTVRRIAGRFDVTGFVRNLADGRVQLVCEGPADQLDQLLGNVADAMSGYIREVDVRRSGATGEFASFDIAF